MVRPISMDLRERLISAVERDGMSARSAAVRFGVSASSAVKWVQRYRATGSVAPDKIGGRKPRLLVGKLREWLLERTQRDFTLRGLAAELSAEFGVKVDYVQVWRFAHEEGLSFKKNRSSRRAAPSRRRVPTRAMEEISGSS
jgi:transposase